MKLNLGVLEPGNKFQLPSGEWLTVDYVNTFEQIPKKRKKSYNAAAGYVEIVTEEPYSARANEWFTAPVTHKVEVQKCIYCPEPAVVLDVAMPKSSLGTERRLCTACMTLLDERRYNTEHYG